MKDDILSYRDMCNREHSQTLQRGMNFRLNPAYSVILMSQRRNAPYKDAIGDDGMTIFYEGHDWPRTAKTLDPKMLDQPEVNQSGTTTQNGRFVAAIRKHKEGAAPEPVRVYEKILPGVWSYKGLFLLVDYEFVSRGVRKVFIFRLDLAKRQDEPQSDMVRERSRLIPTDVKKAVWARDKGRCVECGASDELHFDHDIPYSKGGSSISAENVKILCARHNLSKSDKIQ
jgi:hypothetical protein